MSHKSPKSYKPNEKESEILMRLGKVRKSKRSRRTRVYVAYLKLSRQQERNLGLTYSVGVRFNGGSGNWLCVCCTHRESKLYQSSILADEASRNPEVFCFQCNDYTSGRGIFLDEGGES